MPEAVQATTELTPTDYPQVPLPETPPEVDEPVQAAAQGQPPDAPTPTDAASAPSPTPAAASAAAVDNPPEVLRRGSGMLRFSRAVVGLSLKYFTLVLYIMLAAVPMTPLWRIAFHPETIYLPRATRPGELARASRFGYTMLVLGVLVFGMSCAFCLGLIGWRGFRHWIKQPVGALHKSSFFTGAGIGASRAFELLGHMLSVISVAGTWILKPNKRVYIPIVQVECAHMATYTAVGAVFMLWKGYQRYREPLPNPLEHSPRHPALANIGSGAGLLVLLGLHSMVSYPSPTLLEQVSPTDLHRVATVAEWVCVWLVQQYLKTLYNDVITIEWSIDTLGKVLEAKDEKTLSEQARHRPVRRSSETRTKSQESVSRKDKGKGKEKAEPSSQAAPAPSPVPAPASGESSTSMLTPASKEVVGADAAVESEERVPNEEVATTTNNHPVDEAFILPDEHLETPAYMALLTDEEANLREATCARPQVVWSSGLEQGSTVQDIEPPTDSVNPATESPILPD